MSDHPAKFVWYELLTSDSKGAESFYRHVIGWDARDSGLTDRSYTIFSSGPAMVAGLMPLSKDACAMGARPGWSGYIGVDDVDGCVARLKAAGGTILRAPEDIPGVGRFAVAADPQGAAFALFKGAPSEPHPAASPQAAPDQTGHIGWHELHASDGESAFPFYAGLFGWTKLEAMDMGPTGVYQIFATGGAAAGGMMTKMATTPAPFWLFYVNVDAIDAAVARVIQGGGQVLMGPHQVPGDSWIVQGMDPQGTLFALLAPKR